MGLTSLICSLLGTIYPAYASFCATESAAHDGDKQWLTYWVIHALLVLAEAWAGWLVSWIPFYYQVKLLVVLWLIAPQTQGAKRLYEDFMRPFLYKNAKKIDPVFRGTQAVMQLDVTNQLAKLVEQHGRTAAESVTALLSQLQGGNMARLRQLVRADPGALGRLLNTAVESLPLPASSHSTGASST